MKTTPYIIPNLTPEQKTRVRYLLAHESFGDVRNYLAEPAPHGIGVEMSAATLSRLKKQLELEDVLADRGEINTQANALAREEASQDLKTASLTLLKEKAFQLALTSDPFALELSCRILRNIDRLEKTSRPAGTILTGELTTEIAKTALLQFGQIGSIRGNPALNEERKIQMIRECLFPKLCPKQEG